MLKSALALLMTLPATGEAQTPNPTPSPLSASSAQAMQPRDPFRFCYYKGKEYSKGAVLKDGSKCDVDGGAISFSTPRPLEWRTQPRAR